MWMEDREWDVIQTIGNKQVQEHATGKQHVGRGTRNC